MIKQIKVEGKHLILIVIIVQILYIFLFLCFKYVLIFFTNYDEKIIHSILQVLRS